MKKKRKFESRRRVLYENLGTAARKLQGCRNLGLGAHMNLRLGELRRTSLAV